MKSFPFTASHFAAAVAALLVSYGSSAVIIFQAAQTFGATQTQIASWFTVIGLVCGVQTLYLSVRHKAPVMMAWCTPGAAMMVGLEGVSLAQAVGAFVFAGALMWAVSAAGLFDRLVRHIPPTLAAAMLAGILINFGSRVFVSMQTQTVLVGLMLAVYLLGKIRFPRYGILLMLAAGCGYALLGGLADISQIRAAPPVLEWVSPQFEWDKIIGVGIPLFIASLATQNVPGMAILRAYGYATPAKPLMTHSAAATVLFAPFGAFMVNLAAISSAICMGGDVDKDPQRRYLANVLLGGLYLLLGAAGGMVVSLFAALPPELLAALAGIAVFATLQNNLSAAWQDEATREASLMTLLASASGMNLLGISSAFWGLLLGLAVYYLNRSTARAKA
ncbi:benzoate/H(+) symporter BenE family transporter [Conchiformibius kuhniae]|uniref:Benzoate/H(+) symporter BenE family transporter n=1 Tax=Conchiformibius kuhniae TaxID=211502 RepID=A0A8T9MZ42_9NEIS|nr:benzoate/H(+) symporter BenE family transporter [Conchiformibius kuhniae]UOP05462.1 benzoate/H(+) symporter BenE family transporter [Conchiformibius kuhniae]